MSMGHVEHVRAALHMLILALLVPVSGCIVVRHEGAVGVAPDGTVRAEVSATVLGQLAVDGRILHRSARLDLVTLGHPEHRQTVPLGSYGLELSEYVSIATDAVFSPDSNYVAVVAGYRLWAVQTRSGRCWEQTGGGERVTSCAWANDSTLVYGTVRQQGLVTKTYRRSFWIAQATGSGWRRQRVYAGPGDFLEWLKAVSDFPQDRWGPEGRYVFYKDPERREQRFDMPIDGLRLRR